MIKCSIFIKYRPNLLGLYLFFSTFFSNSLLAQISKNDCEQILNKYKVAYNQSNFSILESCLSKNYSYLNMGPEDSYFSTYLHISIKKPEQISKIDSIWVHTIKSLSDSTFELAFKRKFNNYTDKDICKFILKKNKIDNDLELMMYPKGSYIKGISNDFSNINVSYTLYIPDSMTYRDISSNFTIAELEHCLQKKKNNFTIYYENEEIENLANTSIESLNYISNVIKIRLGLLHLPQTGIYFTQHEGTVFIIRNGNGNNDEVIFPYYYLSNNNFKPNTETLNDFLYSTMSHEITETALDINCGIHSPDTRWYRDGISEYIAYQICKEKDSTVFKNNFLTRRMNEYKNNIGQGNILDWRGNEPKKKEQGKLIGDKYIYQIEYGQYGRSMKFFLDFVEDYGEEALQNIHIKLDGKKSVNQKKILKTIEKITGEKNIIARISKY